MEMAKKISLKPDCKLMNPDFDGYKLCSDADVTLYSKPVSEGVEGRPAGPTCYLGTRLEALHNHIFPDPFHPPTVYYFTSRGHLLRSCYSEDSRLSTGEVVWQADLSDEVEAAQDGQEEEGEGGSHQYHATVSFPAPDLAVVSNGRGSLHLLHTGDRLAFSNHSWLVSFEMETVRGVVIQSCVRPEARPVEGDQGRVIECIMLSVTTPNVLNKNPDFVVADSRLASSKATSLHLLHWLTLTYNEAKWEVSRTRAVAGEGALQYCSLDDTASGIIILAHKNYSFVADSECPIVKPEKIEKKEEEERLKFMFMQTDEDVTVWLNVGEALKGDLVVKVTAGELSVKVKDSEVLQGHFSHSIQADLSTWTLGDGRMELVLPKGTEGEQWESLFVAGEATGEEVVEQDPEVTRRLAHLTSDKWNPDPRPDVQAYDPGELEACDQARDELTLLHLAGSTHLPQAVAHLGPTQHLFNAQIQPSGPAAFCLRHDVDAVLWQPGEEGEAGYTHTTTYDAFGYVRASKTSAKFTCASSDLSYVAVGDTQSHIYVFYQPGVVGGGELRNRRSGQRVGRVARQLVISLRTHDHVMGLHAAPGLLYVLTNKMLYLYCIPSS